VVSGVVMAVLGRLVRGHVQGKTGP
jgi:hypothetical protein